MIKIVFLGTNGWYDTKTGNTMSVLVQTPKYDIILDAGNGLPKIEKYVSFAKPVYLFLSHYHLDHIIGLHVIMKFRFKAGLSVLGPKGLKKMLGTFMQLPFTFPFEKLPFQKTVYELAGGIYKKPIPFECAELSHPVTTLGYRFKIEGKIITYCTDTGYCDNALKLAKDSDLLISECSYKKGQTSAVWPHLNPDEAGRLAQEANAKRMVLSHFDANNYRTMAARQAAAGYARKTFKNTTAAVDEMSIEL